jgi:hypothetical protein
MTHDVVGWEGRAVTAVEVKSGLPQGGADRIRGERFLLTPAARRTE